jgi:hypothetical protein
MTETTNSLKFQLQQRLLLAREQNKRALNDNSRGTVIDVPATGKVLSIIYEQLRNAAEYAEEHLLLQKAIKRFARRTLFRGNSNHSLQGQELIVELVQAGYLHNRTIGSETADELSKLIEKYMSSYGHLRQSHVDAKLAKRWILAYISVEAESLINPRSQEEAVIYLAYQHFLKMIPKDQFNDSPDVTSFEACLYIALHQALLKSDIDVVRYQLFSLYKIDTKDTQAFKLFNEQLDKFYVSDLTITLKSLVSRYGAPFRILKNMIDKRSDIPELLGSRQLFMEVYATQINREYHNLRRKLTRGLIKSVIFLVITKAIIGIGIEVPYDLATKGRISYLPLGVNLLFPPLYMISLKLSLIPPTAANSDAILGYMDVLLYGDGNLPVTVPRKKRQSVTTQLIYVLLFLIPVAITIYILQRIGFNLVQMAIFFTFFSTASYLGFRLSVLVRELELTTPQTGLLASLRDSFYMPFIVSGQWISKKYSKVNLIAQFLDVAIELPLKTSLRLIRKWIKFLNDKRDKLY